MKKVNTVEVFVKPNFQPSGQGLNAQHCQVAPVDQLTPSAPGVLYHYRPYVQT